MNPEEVLCPNGNPELGLITEHCRSVTSSSSSHASPRETRFCFSAAEARICKRVPWNAVVISILLILVILLGLIRNRSAEPWSCALASAAPCSAQCPRRWVGYEGKCYVFSKVKRNWTSSQAFCAMYNASLASIEQEEKDFLMQVKDEGTYWIGLKRMPNQSWVRPNGEYSVLKVTGGGDCVYLDTEASSSGCHAELPCICSKPAGCTDS